MRGVFTRDERVVILFLVASLAIGSLVLLGRRVDPTVETHASSPAPRAGHRVGADRPACGPIDVNAAAAEELTALPGVGPVRAAAIVLLREARGGFGSVDELLDVKGIGPITLERLRPLVVVGDRAAASEAGGASSRDSLAGGSETPR